MDTQNIGNSLFKYDTALTNYYIDFLEEVQKIDDPKQLEQLLEEFQNEQKDEKSFISIQNYVLLTDNIISYCKMASMQQETNSSTTILNEQENIIQLANVSKNSVIFLPQINNIDCTLGKEIFDSEVIPDSAVLSTEPVKSIFMNDMLNNEQGKIFKNATRFAQSYNINVENIALNAQILNIDKKHDIMRSKLLEIEHYDQEHIIGDEFAMSIYEQSFQLARQQEQNIKQQKCNNIIYDKSILPSPISHLTVNVGIFANLIEHQGGYTKELIWSNNLLKEFEEQLDNQRLFGQIMSEQCEIENFCKDRNLVSGVQPPEIFSQFHQNFQSGPGNQDYASIKKNFILCKCNRINFETNANRCDIVNDNRGHQISRYIGAQLEYFK